MPASPSTARAINDRLALRLLQQEGPLTAGQLKQLTGLSRPDGRRPRRTPHRRRTDHGRGGVGGAAARPERQGVRDRRRPRPPGRPRRPYRGRLRRRLRPGGRACWPRRPCRSADDTGTGPAVEQAVALVERAAKEAGAGRLHTVGIGAPGLIDPATGELRDSTGLPEWHRRLVAALQERLPEARVHRRERDQPRRPRRTARRRRPRPGHLRPAVARPRHRRGRGPRRHPAPGGLRRHRRDRLPAGAGHRRRCPRRPTARAASTPWPGRRRSRRLAARVRPRGRARRP